MQFSGSISEMLAQGKGLKFYQSESNAIFLFDTMPSESSVEMDKRNNDDSEGAILNQRKDQILEEVRHIRLKESPYAAQRVVCNHQGSDKPILKITPRLDQRNNAYTNFRLSKILQEGKLLNVSLVKYCCLQISKS